MSRGVNKVILVGNVGNQPEIKQTSGGMVIATLSLATTENRKDKDGNRQEKTEWHRVKFFGKTAEIVREYVQKGSQLYVEGKIEYGKYTDKDGIERYTTDIIGNDMQMIGSKPGGSGGQSQQQSRPAAQRPAPQRREPAPIPLDDFADDDIPFN